MSRSLHVTLVALGTVAIVGLLYLTLGSSGPPSREPMASADPVPPTSPPTLGRKAAEPSPATLVANSPGASQADWEAHRAADDATLWETTASTVAQLATTGGWTDEETDTVMHALGWRHDQLIRFRAALGEGSVDPVEGRAAIVETANKARATVIHAVGTERARALDQALAASTGAGL